MKKEMKMSSGNKDWKMNNLGDVCHFQNGFAFKSKTFKEFGEPVLRITNIQNNSIDTKGFVYIDRKDYQRDLSKYEVKKGDLLIAMSGATTGKIGVHRSESVLLLNQRVGLFKPKKSLNKLFLYYFLSTKVEESLSISAGAAQPNLSTEQIKSFQIPLPPLPEQQRIVSILDECFVAIDKAKANAEQNLKNAKELFESYLQGVFENGDWEARKLGSLCTLITKGSSPKWQGINYVDEPGILFVTSENVGEGKMLLEKRKYVEEKFNQKDRKSILKHGDVLTNIVGASIGRTAIYDIDDVANINQAVCLLRCDPELINNRFLMNLLNSPFLKTILHDNEVNTARANLSLGFFNKLEIPCPTIEQQQTIVSQLDALRAETQKLEAVYQKKMDDLEELKKSILQKAFAGELMSEPLINAD
jgi:type I restriction enzyme S subunit